MSVGVTSFVVVDDGFECFYVILGEALLVGVVKEVVKVVKVGANVRIAVVVEQLHGVPTGSLSVGSCQGQDV